MIEIILADEKESSVNESDMNLKTILVHRTSSFEEVTSLISNKVNI